MIIIHHANYEFHIQKMDVRHFFNLAFSLAYRVHSFQREIPSQEAAVRISQLARFVSLIMVLIAGQSVFGQGITTGSVTGSVQDPQQGLITNAKVTVVQNATNAAFVGKTNAVGTFQVSGVPVGTYTVTIEAPGFAKLQVGNVAVNSGQPTSIGLQTLSVSAAEQEVTVEASAPILQTDSMQIGGTFETQKVADLPVGNGPDILALLTPGVASAGDAMFTNTNGAGFSANGQRGRSNNFQLDGQSNNDTSVGGPEIFFGNQDAIAEVQVLTNYSAEYGHTTGSVVNYITKSGTNQLHGNAFEFYNGDWADALANQDKSPLFGNCPKGVAAGTVTAFAASGCTKPVVPRFVDNRFGGTMGGPIIKDKLWFFGSGNFERQRTGASVVSGGNLLTPDPTGLSQLQAAFPGNAAVASLVATGPLSVKKGTLTFGAPQIIPVNGVPIEFATVTRKLPSIFNDHEGTGRIDWQVTQNDRVFGRYIFQQQINTEDQVNGAAGAAAGEFVDVPARDQQVGIDYAHTFSPTFLNQSRFSYSRINVAFEGGAYPNCTRANFLQCPTSINFADPTTPTLSYGEVASFPQGRFVIDYQVQDNATKQIGTHALKFGGELARQRQPNFFLPDLNGSFTFTSFSNFINNNPATVTIANGPTGESFSENDGAFYLEDDWRYRDNLTLSLGVRYELYSQAINVLHDLTVARESNPSSAIWDPTLPLSARTVPSVPMRKTDFSPIIGFSYSPHLLPQLFGNNQTVIRGGFRLAYDPEFYNIFTNVGTSAPTVNLGNITGCVACLPASGLSGGVRAAALPQLPAGVNPGLRNQTTVSPNFRNPYSEQWQLGIQREIGSHIVGEVRYVGNHDIGLFQDVNPNPALGDLIKNGFGSLIPAGLTPCATPGAPGFASGYANCNARKVLQRANTATSYYDGMQSRLDFNGFHGITAGVSYTWSHTIDTASEIFNSLAGGSTLAYPQNPFNVSQGERANSGIDYPNVASIYMIYELPFFKSQSGFLGKTLGGWQINPVWRYTSGQPYTPYNTRFNGGEALCDPTGVWSTVRSACRPILSSNSAAIDTVGQYITAGTGFQLVDAFTGNPVTTSQVHWIINDINAAKVIGTPYGGAPRNILRGDAVNNVNLAVLKNLKLTERLTLQLRGTAYNVMNRDFRGNPDPLIDDANFANGGSFGNTFFNPTGGGQVNSVFQGIDRRRIEVGAKITF